MILVSERLRWFSAEYSVVVLPLPVGPVTSTMPALRSIRPRKLARACAGGMPSWSSVIRLSDWSSSRITTDSPSGVGIVDRRTSIDLSFTFTEKRPSCGRRFSAMSRPLISFRRVTSALGDAAAFDALLLQHAVDALADAQHALARLDVHVGRAYLARRPGTWSGSGG